MMNDETFFPARTVSRPMIYAYSEDNPKFAGMLKVGFASAGVEKRVAEQFPVLKPGDRKPYQIVFAESAMYSDSGSFTDKRVHEKLVAMGYEQQYHQGKKTEWFKCGEGALAICWTRRGCRLRLRGICISRGRRFAPSIQASSSKIRSTIGRIRTSSGPRRSGV